MEKQLIRWSLWLGLACVVFAVLLRGLDALGITSALSTRGTSISYMSFVKGALLFLLTSIATSSYLSHRS